jgi:glycosyltransferase involved in cell wall biosynthesis
VAAEKVDVVFNWVDESVFRPEPSVAPPTGEFHVMYAGNLGDVQGLDVAIRAVAELGAGTPVRLRLIGTGVAEPLLRKLARELGVEDRVWFEGPRDITEMSTVMASAHVQLVSLRDVPLFHLTIPSKIQAILASGQPLIACAPGDAGALAAEASAGWSVAAGDVGALAQAMREAASMAAEDIERLGQNARAFYEDRLCAERGAAALEAALAQSLEAGQ